MKKTGQMISELHQDLLVDIPSGSLTVEMNQRNESDMLWILRSYMEMDREISLLNS